MSKTLLLQTALQFPSKLPNAGAKADNGKQRRSTLSLLPQQASPANCSNLFPSSILELPKETISSLWKNYDKTFKRLLGDNKRGTAGPEKDCKALLANLFGELASRNVLRGFTGQVFVTSWSINMVSSVKTVKFSHY